MQKAKPQKGRGKAKQLDLIPGIDYQVTDAGAEPKAKKKKLRDWVWFSAIFCLMFLCCFSVY